MIVHLDERERAALGYVMAARLDNVVETRRQTGDAEYDQGDEDECSVLCFALTDFDFDSDDYGTMQHLYDAIWVALDTPEAFPELDYAALRAGSVKVGYQD